MQMTPHLWQRVTKEPLLDESEKKVGLKLNIQENLNTVGDHGLG